MATADEPTRDALEIRNWSCCLGPSDKGPGSVTLMLTGGLFIATAVFVASVAVVRAEWLVCLVTLPFSVLSFWIGRICVSAWWNMTAVHTHITMVNDMLRWRHRPFGKTHEVLLSNIANIVVTDVLDPRVSMELLVVTRDHRTYQLAAFDAVTPTVQRLRERLESACVSPEPDSD